ncbi:MAG: metallophosphoesterase [Alicyclobacillus sp.]|nr:metallophosphoesterase [Alicyclobacillus sp.]
MRLCVVSDTHRHRHELLTAVKSLQPLDGILHVGDETSDVAWLAERVDWPIFAVAGNWDPVTDTCPVARVLDFGVRIWMTHGHKYHVKESLDGLRQQARQVNAQVVVFGHTHKALAELTDGRLFLNPGSLATPRGRRERTCALLEIDSVSPPGPAGQFQIRASHMTIHGEITHTMMFTAATGDGGASVDGPGAGGT